MLTSSHGLKGTRSGAYAIGVGIGAVLTKPLAYVSEKLSGPKLNYSSYDKAFYAVVGP